MNLRRCQSLGVCPRNWCLSGRADESPNMGLGRHRQAPYLTLLQWKRERGCAGTRHHNKWRTILEKIPNLSLWTLCQDKGPLSKRGPTWSDQPRQYDTFLNRQITSLSTVAFIVSVRLIWLLQFNLMAEPPIRSHGVTEVISHSIISDIPPWAASGWRMSDRQATDTDTLIPYQTEPNQTKHNQN